MHARTTLAPDDAVDLHMHTFVSDGRWTPEELTAHLSNEGFKLVALADHDTMRSVPEMRERTQAAGMYYVPAVEMTTSWEDRQVHLLVYGVDIASERARTFAALLQRQEDNLRDTAQRAIDLIERNGRHIPSLASIQGDLPLRHHHVFTAMIRDGHATGLKQAHDIVRALGEPVVVDVPLDETVAAAHAAGALAIVAHPGRDEGMGVLDDEKLDRMLASIPIDGVEAHYRSYTDEDTARYRAWAERHGLVVSAGSDSHRPNHPVNPRKHPARWIAPLLDKLGFDVAPFDEPAWEPAPKAEPAPEPAASESAVHA
jgi:predicted metal-dependent phosphoesterase TrpH